jgi:hypothetical protein
MAKIGRPTVYDEKYCDMLIEYMAKGRSYESFAGVVGVSKQALYDWEKKHPEFLYAKRIGRAKCQATLEDWGESLVKGHFGKGANTSAWIFMMKNMSNWRDDPSMNDDDSISDLEFVDE